MKRVVYYTGSGALLKGQGLCYVRNYTGGTGDAAADYSPLRDRRVELPSLTNNMWFAGVTSENYTAVSGGQLITIYEPGSVCEVLCPEAVTLASSVLTCIASGGASAGFFTAKNGFLGRGTAFCLQTRAIHVSAVGPVGGSLSCGYTLATKRYATITGIESYVQLGDSAIVYANSKTDGGGTTVAFASTVKALGTDYVILDLDNTLAANSVCAIYVYRGVPTCLAYLIDGDESGLVDFPGPKDNAAMSPAPMAGGVSHILGGSSLTLGAGVTTQAFADGVPWNVRKRFDLLGALTTSGVTITNAKTLEPMLKATLGVVSSTGVVTLAAGAAGAYAEYYWTGTNWICVGVCTIPD